MSGKNQGYAAWMDFAMILQKKSMWTTCWAMNEEIVDWIAIQGPKLMKVWSAAKCL